ncbi:MAG TPA: NAD(P)-dependent oxidoreductase [Chthoniobacterales bacterium]|nr:NAD(P)-dependent oxidoreductase [Chthoniobacterales bacterium]
MNEHGHRVVLTGASGALGRNFLDLVAKREDVHVLALLRDASREPPPQERLQFARVDFNDPLSLSRVIEAFAPTCVVHSAATGMSFPRTRWFSLIRFNVDVSINLCQCVSMLPKCHLIFISTGLAYRDQGRPLREDDPLDTRHPYGASKAAADMLVRSAAAEFGVGLTVLRPFSFTGLWDDRGRLFPTLLRAAAARGAVDLSPGDQVRDHCSARDIAAGIAAAMESGEHGPSEPRIYNLGSAARTPLRNVIERVVEEIGLDVELNFGARDYARYEPMFLGADIDRASEQMNWKPKHNLAHAVWQLGCESFPELKLREPRHTI